MFENIFGSVKKLYNIQCCYDKPNRQVLKKDKQVFLDNSIKENILIPLEYSQNKKFETTGSTLLKVTKNNNLISNVSSNRNVINNNINLNANIEESLSINTKNKDKYSMYSKKTKQSDLTLFKSSNGFFNFTLDLSNDEDIIDNSKIRKITDEEIAKVKPFSISSINGGNLFNGKEIIINAGGFINKKIKNGITLFGNNVNNDLDIHLNYNEIKYSVYDHLPYFFMIFYKRESKKYYIKPNKDIYIYMKIQRNKKNKIYKDAFTIGSNLFTVRTLKTRNNTIEISFNDKNYKFPKEKSEITIGRDKNCDIVLLNERDVSRIQTSIYFDFKEDDWFIIDGSKEKESTNGTWLTLMNTTEIYDNMILEIFGERFICKENFEISKS